MSHTWRVISVASKQLRHVLVVIVSVERDGNQQKNNQVFDNAKLTLLSVCVNSRQYPDREIETNFTEASRNYSRAYMLFQKAANKYSDTDSGSQVSVEEFAELYPIIHVERSKHKKRLKMSTDDHEIRRQLASNFRDLVNDDSAYQVYCVVLSN